MQTETVQSAVSAMGFRGGADHLQLEESVGPGEGERFQSRSLKTEKVGQVEGTT